METVQLTVVPGRARQADQLQRALDGRLPRRQLTPTIGGYADVASRLSELVPTTTLRPAPEFRAELHERLVELALSRPPAVSRQTTVEAEPLATGEPDRRRNRRETWLGRGRRRTLTAATGAVLALSVGVGFASAGAVPGGLLYPVKELLQSAQLQLAQGDLARGRVLLDQADSHIGDAQTLVSRGSPDAADVDTALRAAESDIGDAQQALLAHFARTRDPAALIALARFATAQSPALAQLRGRVPVQSEALVDSLLAELGSMATSVRAIAVQCGSACASVPVDGLPGPDGLLGAAASDASAVGGAGAALNGANGSGLGGLVGTGGSGTGGAGAGSGPVSAGPGGVGVTLPGVGATVPAPGASVGPGGAQVTVPSVGATVGPITTSLPGVGVSVPPVLPHSSSHSTAPSAGSSSSSVCVLIICVG